MSSFKGLFPVLMATGLTVGFGHCIGMCGPIAASLSLKLKGKRIFLSHLLYNGGRITTYALLGGLMGLTGSYASLTSRMAGLQKGVLIFSGILIFMMGISMGGWLPLGKIFRDEYNPQGGILRAFQRLSRSGSSAAYFPFGLLLGLLPCGSVYGALFASARVGMEVSNPVEGAVVGAGLMLAFGLGTLPALLLVAKLADLKWIKRRDVIYRIGAFLMVLLGAYFVIKGILH